MAASPSANVHIWSWKCTADIQDDGTEREKPFLLNWGGNGVSPVPGDGRCLGRRRAGHLFREEINSLNGGRVREREVGTDNTSVNGVTSWNRSDVTPVLRGASPGRYGGRSLAFPVRSFIEPWVDGFRPQSPARLCSRFTCSPKKLLLL